MSTSTFGTKNLRSVKISKISSWRSKILRVKLVSNSHNLAQKRNFSKRKRKIK